MVEGKQSLESAFESAYFHRYDYRHTHGTTDIHSQKLVVYKITLF